MMDAKCPATKPSLPNFATLHLIDDAEWPKYIPTTRESFAV